VGLACRSRHERISGVPQSEVETGAVDCCNGREGRALGPESRADSRAKKNPNHPERQCQGTRRVSAAIRCLVYPVGQVRRVNNGAKCSPATGNTRLNLLRETGFVNNLGGGPPQETPKNSAQRPLHRGAVQGLAFNLAPSPPAPRVGPEPATRSENRDHPSDCRDDGGTDVADVAVRVAAASLRLIHATSYEPSPCGRSTRLRHSARNRTAATITEARPPSFRPWAEPPAKASCEAAYSPPSSPTRHPTAEEPPIAPGP
jgi:hypothetical protein